MKRFGFDLEEMLWEDRVNVACSWGYTLHERELKGHKKERSVCKALKHSLNKLELEIHTTHSLFL